MEDDGFLEMVLVPCYLVLVGELLVIGDGCQGVMLGCVNGGLSILSQLSVGSLATWRISVSSRTRARHPCSLPHILVLRLVATYAIALTSLSIYRMVGIA